MMSLNKYKLADIAKIEISGVDKKTIEGEIPVRLCNFVDVYYNWAITKEKAKSFMVASAKQTEIDKCSIGKGMVAITKDSETRDDIGVATYIADDFKNVVLGYHCALITPNPAIVDGKYLNAFMHTRYIQKYFENNASGSGQRYTLSNDTIGNIPVLLPSIDEQHTIGKVLADIDRKIELNKRINDNLEAMAKQLYDYWFVQFDFPNEEGKPYKSSGGAMVWNERLKREIPIGWTCCSIKEMCDINKKTMNKDEHKQIEYLDTGSITQGHISNTEIYSIDMAPSRAQRKVEDLSILYSSVRPRLLHYGILSTPKENFIVSTGFVTLDAKCKKMALMVYYFLTSNTITEHLASIADTAVSSYPSISPDDIAYLDIVIPRNDIIQKYNDIVEPMFRKMSTLRKEIDSLTKQRDELLPLLMNGQATVNYHLSDD